MALFSSWLYVRVLWLYFLPGYINQDENKAMTPSHITGKKMKPSQSLIYPGRK
jgi:hypothetical protein